MQATSYTGNFSRNAQSIRSNVPLTEEQLRRVAPSVFAEQPHSSRGDRYGFIPTIRVLEGLRAEGFQPFAATQTRVRAADRREFTKHMLRLRQTDWSGQGEFNEVVLINSHDGSSAYQLIAGIFRLVCSNGLIAGDTFGEIRTSHTGDVVGEVIEGTYSIVRDFPRLNQSIGEMKAITLTEPQQQAFGRAALALKYDEPAKAPVTETALLTPRRYEDRDPSLWIIFNRVQESLVRGGLRGRSANGRRTRTREIAGIHENVKLNRALWMLAESMKQLVH
jgi:hypothetical protein